MSWLSCRIAATCGETTRQGMLQRRIVVVNLQGERRQLTPALDWFGY